MGTLLRIRVGSGNTHQQSKAFIEALESKSDTSATNPNKQAGRGGMGHIFKASM
jgi:hypothetical protein